MIKTFEQFISEECNEGLLDKLKLKRIKITSDYKKYIEDLETPRVVHRNNTRIKAFNDLSDIEKTYLKKIKLALKDERVAKRREQNKKIVKEYYLEIINTIKDMVVSMHNGYYADDYYVKSKTITRDKESECLLYEITAEKIKFGDKEYKITSVFFVKDDYNTKKKICQLISFYVYSIDNYLETTFSNEELEMTPENKDYDVYELKNCFEIDSFVHRLDRIVDKDRK